MKQKTPKSWVIVKFNDGIVKVWRNFNNAWGSPIYTVLGYFEGSYSDAMDHAMELVMDLAEAEHHANKRGLDT